MQTEQFQGGEKTGPRGGILQVGNIRLGQVVRRKARKSIIYIVDSFFESDGIWHVGGFPPTVWDEVENVELCPLADVPRFIVEALMNQVYESEQTRSISLTAKKDLETQIQKLREDRKTRRPFVYLACPYSHPHPSVREFRFHMSNYAAAALTPLHKLVLAPISYTHPIAVDGDLPKEWEFWEAYARAMLGCCHKVYVLPLPGWQESKGVQAEIAIAMEMGLEVEVLPDIFPTGR